MDYIINEPKEKQSSLQKVKGNKSGTIICNLVRTKIKGEYKVYAKYI